MKKLVGFNKGINFGGWLSQSPHTKEHYDSFITKEDVEKIAKWGIDHVRLPIDYEVIEVDCGIYKEEGFVYINSCIDWCKENGLNLVLDIHKIAGYSYIDAHSDQNNVFTNPSLQDRFIKLWVEIAKRYAKENTVAFELLNEVVETENSKPWNELIYKTVKAIREYAPQSIIIVGGIQWNSVDSVALLDEPYDENIVYNFHFYEPLAFTHQKGYWVENMSEDRVMEYPASLKEYREASKPLGEKGKSVFRDKITEINQSFIEELIIEAVQIANERGVSLYCGEYGVIDQAPLESTVRWFRDIHQVFEKYQIGRAVWSYKEMDFGIIDQHYEPLKNEIIELL